MAGEMPSGLVLEPELIDEAEERRLLAGFDELAFRSVVHSVPPTKELRYSVTFRDLRG
ncbi:MAG: hypothetical protein ABIR67_10075 [Gaiellaceae bacterium]